MIFNSSMSYNTIYEILKGWKGEYLDVSEKELRQLAKNKDYKIRVNVANHPNLPKDLEKQLSVDKSITVRKAIAYNTSTSKGTLEQLIEKNKETVLCWIALNHRLTMDIAIKLLITNIPLVVSIILKERKLGEQIIDYLNKWRDDIDAF